MAAPLEHDFYAINSGDGDIFYGFTFDAQGRYSVGQDIITNAANGGVWDYHIYATQYNSTAYAADGLIFTTAYYDGPTGLGAVPYYTAHGYASGTNGIASEFDYVDLAKNGNYSYFGLGYYDANPIF